MKRRRFLELWSAATAGALVPPYVPEKHVQTYGGLTAEQRIFQSQQLIKRLLPHLVALAA